jgi:hypothetical protein
MHPALYSWREAVPAAVVRLMACLGAAAVVSFAAMQVVTSRPPMPSTPPADRPQWIEIEKPFPAFALAIPEAAEAPAHYAILRNPTGGGRKDILTLGERDGIDPYLHVEIYRPGEEIDRFAAPAETIAGDAAALAPQNVTASSEPLPSKFGPLTIVPFASGQGVARQCLGFVRSYDQPMLQISGWFCRGGGLIARETLACALDRLTPLSAGSEPKIGALFAQAELHRSFCGQHDPILAPTPKFKLLWKALATRPEPRRIGR